ncbi:MAG TPA: type II toxin-antitoxin system VapC family toxin [Acidimicrobiales bacterium]|nr:type II toxin-antitoxin system VapC family toxin [Acidimicrobiales bacterium]
MIDASAAVLGLMNDGEARATLEIEAVVCPHLADSEVVHALRSQVLRGDLDGVVAERMIDVWQRLGLERVGVSGLLGRVWELRENLSAYDATYVALAEALESPLVTADGRLARAPGPRCTITLVRR